MISQPVFLVGAERSGTTLLRLMLDHHPRIAFLFEFEIWIGPDGSFLPKAQYCERLRESRWFQDTGFSIDESLPYPQLLDSFLEQGRSRAKADIVGATLHKNFDRVLHVWPDARFIHILRDGRDVARSGIPMGWYADIWSAGAFWLEAERTWDELAARLPAGRFIEIRYEDLVVRPRETLSAIAGFLGLPFSDEMLAYDRDTTYSLPDPRNVSQWSKKLSTHEVRLIEARVGEMLARRGYPLSGQPPLRVGALHRACLALKNRVGVWKFRIGRYGFWPLALARLTRPAPSSRLHRRLMARQREIDRAYLK